MRRTTIVSVAAAVAAVTMAATSPAMSTAPRGLAPTTPPTPRRAVPNVTAAPTSMPATRLNPDPSNRSGDMIEVSIASQRLTAWRDGVVVMRFVVSTGRPGYDTPTGHYHVIFKDPMVWSAPWRVWMPWAINWHGNYFIHQLPHYPGSSENIGASELGRPASHGCVRVNVGDARRLYDWTKVGIPVWVH